MGTRILLCFMLIGCLFIMKVPPKAMAGNGSVNAEASTQPQAVQGRLDLSGIRWNEAGMVSLDGEWEFLWGELVSPEEWSRSIGSGLTYMKVPQAWKQQPIGDGEMSNYGYATYRLLVKTDPSSQVEYAMYMPSVATSYKLYVNGKPAASNGIVGRSPSEMQPKNYPKVVMIGRPAGGDLELIVQVSNFVQRKGGLWESVKLGTRDAVTYEREKKVMLQMFTMGSLVIMGGYHIVLYGLRRVNKAPLFFGATCLAIALRTFVLGETLAVKLFPELSWELVVKVEYITTILAMPMVMRFCYEQYRYRWSARLSKLSLVIGGLFSGLVLVTPARVYTYGMPYYQWFAVAMFLYLIGAYMKAWLQKREGARLNFAALLIFFLTVLNDVFFYSFIIHTREMISIGLLIFLFAQSVNLSIQFTRAFSHNEQLSEELKLLNEGLEEKVKERTGALEESNRVLSLMEQSRRALLTNVSHELRTPLTSIQGFAHAMVEGVIKKENYPKYLQLIHEKSLLLDRLFRDLLELSKLEARKIDFQFEPIPVHTLLQDLFGNYEWEITNAGIQAVLEMPDTGPSYLAIVNVDRSRMDQAFGNLLMNAKRYTPEGGVIKVSMELPSPGTSDGKLVVKVTDTGKGMEAAELPYIFDRFYRGRQSGQGRSAGGTGLGLAITKEIIECHQGHIGVESEPDKGSTFYFTLPFQWIEVESEPGGDPDESR